MAIGMHRKLLKQRYTGQTHGKYPGDVYDIRQTTFARVGMHGSLKKEGMLNEKKNEHGEF